MRLCTRRTLSPIHWTSRGRMRGKGATCTAPMTQGRPKCIEAREHCKIGAECAQRRRLSVTTATLASQRPVARGFASRSTGLAGRVRHYGLRIRATTRVFCGPGDQQAPISRQESEGGTRRRVWRPPGGESTSLMYGYGTIGSSSLHAGSAIGWLAPRP